MKLYALFCCSAKPCLTFCDPLDCSLPGFSVHGIFQARILEWVAISFSRGSSWPRIKPTSPRSPALEADCLSAEPLGKILWFYKCKTSCIHHYHIRKFPWPKTVLSDLPIQPSQTHGNHWFFHCCFHFAKQSCSFASSRDFPGGSDGKESACNVGDLHWFLSWEDALDKEMVIHSSVLAWRIPRSEEPEPGRLQFMGCRELDVTDWVTHTHTVCSFFILVCST